jgi:hypothetical protein
MKRAALPIPAAFAFMGGIALAQGADDPLAQLRACSLMERAERLECLDRLSHAVSPARPAPQGSGRADAWIVSQTTSPVDYSPIATATTTSRGGAEGPALQLSIRCRGGRTELAIAGATISGRAEDYVISYHVNGGQPVQIAAAAPAFGAGIAFKADSATLLQSLPGEGELAVHLVPRLGTAQDGVFSLDGLATVRARMEAACKWPHAVAKPNN